MKSPAVADMSVPKLIYVEPDHRPPKIDPLSPTGPSRVTPHA